MAVTDSKIKKKTGPFGTKVPLRNEMLLHMILYLWNPRSKWPWNLIERHDSRIDEAIVGRILRCTWQDSATRSYTRCRSKVLGSVAAGIFRLRPYMNRLQCAKDQTWKTQAHPWKTQTHPYGNELRSKPGLLVVNSPTVRSEPNRPMNKYGSE